MNAGECTLSGFPWEAGEPPRAVPALRFRGPAERPMPAGTPRRTAPTAGPGGILLDGQQEWRLMPMKLSARNVIKGKIRKLIHGPVSTEVVLDLPGGFTLKSVITHEAAEDLRLIEGKDAYAIIKATSVMIGVD